MKLKYFCQFNSFSEAMDPTGLPRASRLGRSTPGFLGVFTQICCHQRRWLLPSKVWAWTGCSRSAWPAEAEWSETTPPALHQVLLSVQLKVKFWCIVVVVSVKPPDLQLAYCEQTSCLLVLTLSLDSDNCISMGLDGSNVKTCLISQILKCKKSAF